MTVDAIRLQNFMAFEDTDWVDLRPITLLFGRNSSGKSVLIRSLLLLRQSVQQAREGDVFVFSSLHGVDIGSFREMAYNGKDDPIVRFHFRCVSSEIENILAKSGHPDIKRLATPTLQIALGYAAEVADKYKGGINLSDLEISLVNEEGQTNDLLFRATLLNEEDVVRFGEEWYVDGLLTAIDENVTWKEFGCRIGRGFLDVKFTPPESNNVTGYKILEDLFGELRQEIQNFLNQIVHLGPIRPEPQRRYSFSQKDVVEWKLRGWTAFLDFVGGRMGEERVQSINGWLQSLELATGTETNLTSETGSLYTEFAVTIRERETMKPLPLSAMGFGLSQVLPIIVQCVSAQPGSLIIIEQPELHLHPRAQANLGDLFIAVIQNGMHQGRVKFLIETHSEHLLLRLRRRIAESSIPHSDQRLLFLTKNDLDVRFVYREGLTSKVVYIGVDDRGELDTNHAPQQFNDFFADDLIELAALVRASLGGGLCR